MRADLSGRRLIWLDALRGLAVFMVILGHLIRSGVLSEWFMCTGLAVFFFVSGAVFRRGNFKETAKRVRKIWIPYFLTGIFSIAVYRVLGAFAAGAMGISVKDQSIPGALLALLYGNSKSGGMKWNETLWFFPCYIMVFLAASAVNYIMTGACEKYTGTVLTGHVLKNSVLTGYAFTAGISLVGAYVLSGFPQLHLPFQAETAFMMYPVFASGLIVSHSVHLKDTEPEQKQRRMPAKMAGTAGAGILLTAAGIALYCRFPGISIRGDVYPSFAASVFIFLTEAAGLFLVFKSAGEGSRLPESGIGKGMQTIGKCRGALAAAGRNSMGIMLFNKFPILLFQIILKKIFPAAAGRLLGGVSPDTVLIALIPAGICAVISFMMYRTGQWIYEQNFFRRKTDHTRM